MTARALLLLVGSTLTKKNRLLVVGLLKKGKR